MKLAEALVERKGLKDEIKDLRQRLQRVAKVQEGDEPVENPQDLQNTLDTKLEALEQRIVQINQTNMQATLSDGRSLMEAIAQRDILLLRRNIKQALVDAAMPTHDRFSVREIRFVPSVDIAQVQGEADQVAQRFRELDAQIQALNWETELIE